jgi:hypothetical protein
MLKRSSLVIVSVFISVAFLFSGLVRAFSALEKEKRTKEKIPNRQQRVIKSGAPESQEIIHAIFLNQDVDLSVDESCPGAWTGLDGNTMGHYFSALISASASKEFEGTKLKVSSKPGKWDKTKESGWACEVNFYIDDPESPWNRGINFFMRSKDRSIIKDSFMCPGTP